MTGFQNFTNIFAATQRAHMEYFDGLNPPKKCIGTGFWVMTERNNLLFVTNRHNVDASLSLSTEKYSLTKFEVDNRLIKQSTNQIYQDTDLLDITKWTKYTCGEEINNSCPDVIVFLMPIDCKFSIPADGDYGNAHIPQGILANSDFINNSLQAGDSCHFIGFPGLQRINPKYDLPISRNCNISSLPTIDYHLESGTKTSDTCLVNGLSFGGSSGSPVFSYPKGIKIGAGLKYSGNGNSYVEPRLIGIMSGHWDEQYTKEHTGLSYFTKSTSILKLIEAHGL